MSYMANISLITNEAVRWRDDALTNQADLHQLRGDLQGAAQQIDDLGNELASV
jgi:hypothetical protein